MLLDNPVRINGVASVNVVNSLESRGRISARDWARLRQPFLDDRGRSCVSITDLDGGFTRNDSRGGEKKPLIRTYTIFELMARGYPTPVTANAATLRKEDWIQLDKQIVRAFRQELRAVTDLESAGLTFGGFNAMGKTTLEYQAMSDPGEAVVDMDGLTEARQDTPLFNLRSTPLPITHAGFGYSDRELQASRNSDTPLDTTMGECSSRRIAESVEDQLIGNVTGVTYATQTAGPGTHTGTSTVYGYRNFPQRLTKSNFTAPTAGGWVPNTTYNEMLAAIQLLLAQYLRGPFVLYHSLDWNQYMNQVFAVSGGNNANETLLTMLKKIPQIQDVRLLERLTSTFTFLLVGMNPMTVQLVNGMDVTTVQWDEKGGLAHRWEVLCIKVPRLRSDYTARSAILHGTTA